MSDQVKASPYYKYFMAENGDAAEWVVWNDFHDAMAISDVAAEARAGREQTALLDVSGLQKLRITGPQAADFLDTMFIRKVSGMRHDRVAYVATVNKDGFITDDATLHRYSDEDYMLTSGASLLEEFQQHSKGFDAQVTDVTDDYSALAVYGKTSFSVLKHMGIEGLETLKSFQIGRFQYQNEEIVITRTGFSGDLGYEVWASYGAADKFAQGLLAARDRYTVVFAGLTSLDVLRVEAGYIVPGEDFELPGAESNTENYRTPFDMGLDWMVQLDRGDFVGKEALVAEQQRGSNWKFASIVLDAPEDLGYGSLYGVQIVDESGAQVGRIAGGGYSPTMEKNIGVANIRPEVEVGTRVLVGDNQYAATIVETPLFDTQRRTETPPAFYES